MRVSAVCGMWLVVGCSRQPTDDEAIPTYVAEQDRPSADLPPSAPTPVPTKPEATMAESKTPCPEGMALVPGGRWSEQQLERFARWNREVEPEAQLVFADTVEPFCLDLREFTWDRYAACVRTKQCPPPDYRRGWIAYYLPEEPLPLDEAERARVADFTADEATRARQFARHPVTNISSLEALEMCEALGGALPTLEQWLWAYHGGEEHRPSPWGEAPADITRSNLCDGGCRRMEFMRGDDEDCETRACKATSRLPDDGFIDTAPVGSFPKGAGRWGHLDLDGNVFETVIVRVPPLVEQRREPDPSGRTRAGVFEASCGTAFFDSVAERGRSAREPWFPCFRGGGGPISNLDYGRAHGFRCARQPLGGSFGNNAAKR